MAEVGFNFHLLVICVQRVQLDLSKESQSFFAANTEPSLYVFLGLESSEPYKNVSFVSKSIG